MKTIDLVLKLTKRVKELEETVERMENLLRMHELKINDNTIDIKCWNKTLGGNNE